MSNKYTLLVEADLDQDSSFEAIQKSLRGLGQKLELEIKSVKVSLDQAAKDALKAQISKAIGVVNVGVTASVTGTTTGGGVPNAPTTPGRKVGGGLSVLGGDSISERAYINIAQRIKEIEQTAVGMNQKVSSSLDMVGDTVRRVTLKYTNGMDTAVTETYRLNQKTGELILTNERFSDNESRRAKLVEQRIVKETQGIKTIQEAYSRLAAVKERISSAVGIQQTTSAGGLIDTSKMVELQNAATNYESIVNKIQTSGNIIGPDDNQRLAQARIELDKINKSLDVSVKQSTEMSERLDRAKDTLAKTSALTTNKSPQNDQVKAVVAANAELERSILSVSNAAKAGIPITDDQIRSLNKAEEASKGAGAALRAVGKDANSWTHEIGIALKRTVEWAGAMTLLYGTLRQIQQGIQFIKELNKEMVAIQTVTGTTNAEISTMSLEFNKLAKELGATTKEVASGSASWFRQGKTLEETSELMRSTMMLSKLGNMESAQATEYLTSTLNGFKLEAEDAVGVVDKLIYVDNNLATSAAEVAEALSRSSNSAQQMGVDFNELVSYVGVVSSVSRRSAESVGEAFKTIFTRMGNIKLGKMFEDDTTNINDVEKALSLVNIKLRDSETSFRPLGDVLDEVGAKWGAMNTVQRNAVTAALAGTRQAEILRTALANYNQVLEIQEGQLNATGLATERYKIYMEGLEAAQNKLTASWEKMWMKTFSENNIGAILNLISTILDLVGDIGLLNIAFGVLGSYITSKLLVAFPMLINMVGGLGGATVLTTGAVTALNVALTAGIGIAIVGLIALFDHLNVTMLESVDEFNRLKAATDERTEELGSLSSEYEKLANKEEKSKEDLVRLSDIQTILSVKYGMNAESMDIYTDAIEGNSAAIEENIAWMQKRAELEAQKFVDENTKAYDKAKNYLEEEKLFGGPLTGDAYHKATVEDRIHELQMRIQLGKDVAGANKRELDYLLGQVDAAKQLIIDMEHYKAVLSEVQKERVAGNAEDSESLRDVFNAEKETETIEMIKSAIEETYESLSKIGNEMQSLIDAQNQYGELTLEQVNKLKDLVGEDYYKALIVEGDQIKLNTEELRKMILEKINDSIVSVRDALAIDKENEALKTQLAVLQAYYNQVKNGSVLTEKTVKDQEAAYKDLLDITIKMIKERTNAEIEALRRELAAFKKNIEDRKDAIKDAADAELDALEDQLDGYERIIEAQKRLIEQKREEEKYNDAIADKNKEISDIDAELLALQFDNSEEANARRLELEEERARAAEELANMEADHSVESQTNALDEELEAYQRYIENQQEAIQANLDYQLEMLDREYEAFEASIQSKIDQLQTYLDSSGLITAEAMRLLSERTEKFYKDLLEWNKRFGTSVDRDITSKLETAFGYLMMMNTLAGTVASQSGGASGGAGGGAGVVVGENYHTGGVVGKAKNSDGEHFAKLLESEVVLTPQDISKFMRSTLPGLMSSGGGGFSVGDIQLQINVEGNLDKTVIPDLKETIFETLNEVIKSRGVRRNAFSYSV